MTQCVHLVHMNSIVEEPIRVVRSHFADVVDRVASQSTVVTRHGKRVAAIVSVELLERFEELEERELNRIIDERMADPAPGIPLEEVLRETLARDD